MFSYFIQRVLVMIPTLLVISILTFVIIQLPPGDYLSNQLQELKAQGESASAAAKISFYREQYSLDKPMIEQYAIWMGFWPGPNGFSGLIQGNWGHSFAYDLPVQDVLGDRMLLTFVVNFSTIIFIYLVAFPIGVYSATRQYSIGDYGFTLIGYLGLATPNFLLAMVLLYYANYYFGLSIGGLMDEKYLDQPWSFDKFLSVLDHMIIPVIVIGTSGTAAMIRRLRANLLDELQKQYVTTAKAKGVPKVKALVKYPVRMSLNPFIADIGNLLPDVISGSVIVSAVLSLPTAGPMLLEALRSQDQYLAGSFLMFLALLTVIGMFISDVLLALLDPRIRLSGGATK
ncbi:ABC transporter permease subunit [Sneathiella sp. P13V-1]|uniref:ABC transporter permease n=1 Tax=Sneathiella sp. P13V-1 TaxID=2697366 RepID=UPI00187B4DC2|nr:ABC transporter permease [Sneathiella sp. P13V-1]MBE7635821.1 ABC transporter permease subunit [Sneathiella sp. P13V-1]